MASTENEPQYFPKEEEPRTIRGEHSPFAEKFIVLGATIQLFFLILYATITEFEKLEGSDNTIQNSTKTLTKAQMSIATHYNFFQDIQMMVFVGFGFLMAWLKKHAYSSVGFNLFAGAFVVQWGGIIVNVLHLAFGPGLSGLPLKLDLEMFVYAEFAAATVCVSLGAVIGTISPLQLMVLCILEPIFFAINESLCTITLKAVDSGGAMYVHLFGCYFGLAVAFMIPDKHRKGAKGDLPDENDQDSTYRSDLFSLVGSIFLWLFFPSFNGAVAPGNAQSRVVVNTVLALASSCTCTFYTSRLFRGYYTNKVLAKLGTSEDRFGIREIQSATMAGGVAAGSCVSLLTQPWGAVLIGSLAGTIATVGHVHLSGWLTQRGIHDVMGVHFRHGLPGFLGGLAGVFAVLAASSTNYGEPLSKLFPEMANGRSKGDQAGMQAAALFVTLAMALVSGALTGLIIRWPYFEPMRAPFLDDPFWLIPGEERKPVVEEEEEGAGLTEGDDEDDKQI